MDKEIYIDNLRVHYKINGEGQSILILHGWGSSSNSWEEVQKILFQNNFQVIIPDLPGFGKSDLPTNPWDVDQYANFVVKFCQQLKINKFNLIGHSFGGRISIKIAVKRPDKIKNLILVDSAGIKPKLDVKDKLILFSSKIVKSISKIKFLNPFIDKIKRLFYKTAFRKRDYAKLSGVMRKTFIKIIDEDLLPELNKIRVRTLIIWGEEDKSVPIRYAHIFKREILNSELKVIPHIGHSPNLKAPKQLSQLIINFLTENG